MTIIRLMVFLLRVGLNLTSNGGAAEILGVDWTLSWLASEQLELGFSGNYMDTEFVEINVTCK